MSLPETYRQRLSTRLSSDEYPITSKIYKPSLLNLAGGNRIIKFLAAFVVATLIDSYSKVLMNVYNVPILTSAVLLVGLVTAIYLAWRRAHTYLVVTNLNLYIVDSSLIESVASLPDDAVDLDLRRGEGEVVLQTKNQKHRFIVLTVEDAESTYTEIRQALETIKAPATTPAGELVLSVITPEDTLTGITTESQEHSHVPHDFPQFVKPIEFIQRQPEVSLRLDTPTGITVTHGIICRLILDLADSIEAIADRELDFSVGIND
ncbi:MAG: hypothetical protein K8F91_23545 [Candidatus Obscuribacterales bacterium]|nr:hypothetical protein [Candidatus Obscuribacterales bacterium]